MDQLIRYDWPGNVRELMNAVERAVVLARTDYLDDQDFSILQPSIQQPTQALSDFDNIDNIPLEDVAGNKSEAARRLGITRKTLHKKLKKYGVMD